MAWAPAKASAAMIASGFNPSSSHRAPSHRAPSHRAPSHPASSRFLTMLSTFACVKDGCSRDCLVYRHGRNDGRGLCRHTHAINSAGCIALAGTRFKRPCCFELRCWTWLDSEARRRCLNSTSSPLWLSVWRRVPTRCGMLHRTSDLGCESTRPAALLSASCLCGMSDAVPARNFG